jgi:small subunit ribosomal protein S20
MPNIRQQEKRVRTAARERLENLRYRSTVKTLTRRLQTAVESGDADAVTAQHRELVRWIDRAAANGAGRADRHRPARLAGGYRSSGRSRHVYQGAREFELAREPATALDRMIELGEPDDGAP